MSLEVTLFSSVVVVLAFMAWREARTSKTSKLERRQKVLASRVDALDSLVGKLPDNEVLAELESKLTELEQKTGASPSVALKALVDRVNTVSIDATALKVELETLRGRLARIETNSSWSSVGKREVTRE